MAGMIDATHPAFRRWCTFAHAYFLYTKRIERALGPWNLSLPQFLTLVFVGRATQPVTPAQLADYLAQERQSVSGLLQRLQKRRLVERTRSVLDGRSVTLRLSPSGMRMLEQAWPVAFHDVIDFFAPLSEEAQQDFEYFVHLLRERAATSLGVDVARLEYASWHAERDPDMWTQAAVIRDAIPMRR